MPLIYITGPAGSGKSALTKLLRDKGLNVYDEDDPDVGSAHNLQTGEPVTIPDAHKRDSDWFTHHEWRVLNSAKIQLKALAEDQPVILFGNSIKPEEQSTFFDKVIYLRVDEKTLRDRILNRTDNDYGKSEEEMQLILERKRTLDELYDESDALLIDATKSLEDVANTIEQIVS